jgi:prepilin-type N-terminal cleavage/methylation domain-containing protein
MLTKSGTRNVVGQEGFTLIELLVAMTVFSFMLVIIVVGFINIVQLHNQAIASNLAQDSARTAMDEMVRAVRDSAGAITTTVGPLGTVCVGSPTAGLQRSYYINGGILYRADNCVTHANPQAITSSSVMVSNFEATIQSTGPQIVKPAVQITITVGSNNGTTTGAGAALTCGPTNAERTFCSVVTLTSGAEPR